MIQHTQRHGNTLGTYIIYFNRYIIYTVSEELYPFRTTAQETGGGTHGIEYNMEQKDEKTSQENSKECIQGRQQNADRFITGGCGFWRQMHREISTWMIS